MTPQAASAYASVSVDAPDADAVSRLASDVARGMREPGIVFLSGELGAGKTHWTRALLRALGETSPVPSPTFPLAQTYRPSRRRCCASFGFLPSLPRRVAGGGDG